MQSTFLTVSVKRVHGNPSALYPGLIYRCLQWRQHRVRSFSSIHQRSEDQQSCPLKSASRLLFRGLLTILPISVEPRAHAKSISLHPPRLNSFEEVPVPPSSWRTSTGPATASPVRRETITDWVYISIVSICERVWWDVKESIKLCR